MEDVTRLVGYELKRVVSTLRAAMDEALREHGLTVPQYACLELLARQPDLSNADLARGAFVTRQSMNVVLRGLQQAGLVHRPATAASGRALPARITPDGERALAGARDAVLAIERRMTSVLPPGRAEQLGAELHAMAAALSAP